MAKKKKHNFKVTKKENFAMAFINPKKVNTHFICEICHCVTPIEFEGGEPNTCAMCVPLSFNNDEINNRV